MIAAGRTVKKLHPDAVTIFVGPCIAKKAEAREADLAGAVDYVLTFQEMQDIFQAADIHPELLEESERDHSSRAGRIYARTGRSQRGGSDHGGPSAPGAAYPGPDPAGRRRAGVQGDDRGHPLRPSTRRISLKGWAYPAAA